MRNNNMSMLGGGLALVIALILFLNQQQLFALIFLMMGVGAMSVSFKQRNNRTDI